MAPQPLTVDQHPTSSSEQSSETLTRNKPRLRPHPPRLQHSPSLPNLWLPPHFGPIPPRLMTISRENLHQPATPPSLVTTFVLPDIPSTASSTSEAHAESDDPAPPKKPFRLHRADQERSNALLTPPLTPSSSIRTTASAETNATSHHTGDFETENSTDQVTEISEADVDDAEANTRFLMMQNISPDATSSQLDDAFINALRKLDSTKSTPTRQAIKCFSRRHQANGVILLLFFDTRVAVEAKELFSQPDIFPPECVAKDKDTLDCSLATLEDIIQLTGYSDHLASMDSSFYLHVNIKTEKDGGDQEPESSAKLSIGDHEVGRDLAMLKRFLGSFGMLRLFAPAHEISEDDATGRLVLVVDYYDVRDAISAFDSLNDRVLFGLHLLVSKIDTSTPSLPASTHQAPSGAAEASHNISFTPASPLHGHSQSLTYDAERLPRSRDHILATGTLGRIRPRSMSVDNNQSPTSDSPTTPLSANPINGGSVYLYSSAVHPRYHAYPAAQIPDICSQRESDHTFGGTSEVPTEAIITQYPSAINPSNDVLPAEMPNDQPWLRLVPGQQDSGVLYSAQALNMDNYFFPPRDLAASHTIQTHYYPITPPLQPQQPGPRYLFPYPQGVFSRDVDMVQSTIENGMHTVVNAVTPIDGSGVVPTIIMPGSSVANASEFWLSSPVTPHSGAVMGQTLYQSSSEPRGKQSARFGSSNRPRNSASTTDRRSAPSTSPGAGHPGHSSKPGTKNNALDIPAIEAGLDTRTTVMIRNIPNKMSDQDLIAYIDSVCPRRIDFLYLRMDFGNGCNVGYAFVNFIAVEDLLTFAKAKLGHKWNMFSSEKVLEMSYADYQGKEAQVEKFKNSSIMDAREAWRPKIFRSEPGPDQGLPEPFPAPTHLRRKQLSSYNRGGLYPSTHSHDNPNSRRTRTHEHRGSQR